MVIVLQFELLENQKMVNLTLVHEVRGFNSIEISTMHIHLILGVIGVECIDEGSRLLAGESGAEVPKSYSISNSSSSKIGDTSS